MSPPWMKTYVEAGTSYDLVRRPLVETVVGPFFSAYGEKILDPVDDC